MSRRPLAQTRRRVSVQMILVMAYKSILRVFFFCYIHTYVH